MVRQRAWLVNHHLQLAGREPSYVQGVDKVSTKDSPPKASILAKQAPCINLHTLS